MSCDLRLGICAVKLDHREAVALALEVVAGTIDHKIDVDSADEFPMREELPEEDFLGAGDSQSLKFGRDVGAERVRGGKLPL